MAKKKSAGVSKGIVQNNIEGNSPEQRRMVMSFVVPLLRGKKAGSAEYRAFAKYHRSHVQDANFTIILDQIEKLSTGKGSVIGYLTVENPQYGPVSSFVSPVYNYRRLNPFRYVEQSRFSNVCFAADHIETRFKDTGAKLDYQDVDFNESTWLAILLGHAVKKAHLSGEVEQTSVLIPHRKGVFLGRALNSGPRDVRRRVTACIEKEKWFNEANGTKLQVASFDEIQMFDRDTAVRFNLLTFVPDKKGLRRVYEDLRQEIYDAIEPHTHTSQVLWRRFLDFASDEEPDLDAVAALDDALERVVTGPLWRKQIEIGQHHLPQNKWRPDDTQPR